MERHLNELTLYIAGLCWGVWLLLPWVTFNPESLIFMVTLRIAPETAWGLVMIACAMLGIVGYITKQARSRKLGLLLMSLVWLTAWLTFFIGNWRSISTVTYIWFVILCGIAFLRVQNYELPQRGHTSHRHYRSAGSVRFIET